MYYIPQRGDQNRLDHAEIKARLAQKAGNWEILYPDIDDIVRLRTRVEVRCKDCGRIKTIGLQSWISPKQIGHGCPYCERDKKNAKLSKLR